MYVYYSQNIVDFRKTEKRQRLINFIKFPVKKKNNYSFFFSFFPPSFLPRIPYIRGRRRGMQSTNSNVFIISNTPLLCRKFYSKIIRCIFYDMIRTLQGRVQFGCRTMYLTTYSLILVRTYPYTDLKKIWGACHPLPLSTF